jgi:hypothetical protein
MEIFRLFENGKPKSDPKFVKRLDADLKRCGFSEEITKGFLFFLGWSTPLLIDEIDDIKVLERIINLYSVPSGDFGKYGMLNDFVFAQVIYTANYIIHKNIIQDLDSLDAHLRSISLGERNQVLFKTEPDAELVNDFKNLDFKLEPITNFYDKLFVKMGNHLHDNDFSFKKCYEAGFAYYNMGMHMDTNGTRYLIEVLSLSLPSIYSALRNYPLLYVLYPEELAANHIFSSILQFFYKGIPRNILGPIHEFHQVIFYEPGTTKLRKSWNSFNEESIIGVFINAAKIRLSHLFNSQEEFLQFNDMHMPELKGASININDLFKLMQHLISDKYGIKLYAKYNHTGEFMQALGVLFYETCLHAMVLKNLDYEDF